MAEFWARLDSLIASNVVIIDRPKGSQHPRYPDIIYPLDYGYLKNTTGGDGHEIDIWMGSMLVTKLVGIACTVDLLKCDAEVKLLIGCTPSEIKMVNHFHNNDYMSGFIIERSEI